MTASLGALLQAFLIDELPVQKGFRPSSIKAYRDGLRLFLTFVATDRSCRLTQLTPEVLTGDARPAVSAAPRRPTRTITVAHETTASRSSGPSSNFSRGAAPSMLDVAQQVAAIAVKRAPPAETRFPGAGADRAALSPVSVHGATWRFAIARCCCCCTTPVHACRRSPTYASRISSSGPRAASDSMGRATSGAAAHSGHRPFSCLTSCSKVGMRDARPRRRSLSPAARARSRASASTRSSAATPVSSKPRPHLRTVITSVLTSSDTIYPS